MRREVPILAVLLALAAAPSRAAEPSSTQADESRAGAPHAQRVLAWPGQHRTPASVPVRPDGTRPALLSSDAPDTRAGRADAGSPRQARHLVGTRAFSPVKLSGGGEVDAFAVSPDGLTAVWVETVAGIAELYSRPIDGSLPAVHLTAGQFGAGDFGVSDFDLSPDGSTVVFTGDFLVGAETDSLGDVAIGGGTVATLNRAMVDEPVTAFLISPDSQTVLYLGLDATHGSGRVDLHTNSIAGGTPVQISAAGLSPHAFADVVTADFTLDSAQVIYAGDILNDGRLDLFAGAVDGSSNATLSSTLGTATWFAVVPGRVIFISDEDTFAVQEVYSVLLDGTGALKLNTTMAGNATDLIVSADGTRAAYRADQDLLGVTEGYTALVDVAGSSTKVHADLSLSRDTDSLNLAPDSARAIYRADELQPGVIELYSRPLDQSEPSALLHDAVFGETVGLIPGRGVPVSNRRAVYPFFGEEVELYSVAVDGTEPFTRLSTPELFGNTLFNLYVPLEQSARLVAYGEGPGTSGTTERIFSVPIRNDLAPEQLNVTAGVGDRGVGNYLINETETHGIYTQDQDTQGLRELYSVELDSDADGAGNTTDSCRFSSNPGAAAVPFGQVVTAPDKTTLSWPTRTEVTFAQGPIPLDGAYTTTSTGSLDDANSLDVPPTPSPGSGIWTLVAPACGARDWGSPARDSALP